MLFKYNPAFYGDEELIRSFVVRQPCLDYLVGNLAARRSGKGNHVLIVGPRGSGKTTLVLRVAAELRRMPELMSSWFPVVFAEESYEVSSPGEFWLQALIHLGDQIQDHSLVEFAETLKEEVNETKLCNSALEKLLCVAARGDRRILLIVENFDMLIEGIRDKRGPCDLRRTLALEQRITLLATVTTLFGQIDRIDQKWLEIFEIKKLQPLRNSECSVLWKSVTGEELPSGQLRAIHILSGGNPRLLTILAGFAVRASFRELMGNLTKLVDEHTEYFKSQLDQLASIERKVFAALLDSWDPIDARSVAKSTRMTVSKASALLARLSNKGAVLVSNGNGRRHKYQVAERLFNIYYLMRKRGHPANRVRAVVRFMVEFYRDRELVLTMARLSQEACALDIEKRQDHYWAYGEALKHVTETGLRTEIIKATPSEFFAPKNAPDSLRRWADAHLESEVPNLLAEATRLRKGKMFTEAEQLYGKALHLDPNNVLAWIELGALLEEDFGRHEDAERAYRNATKVNPESVTAWLRRGLLAEAQKRFEAAEEAYRKALAISGDSALALVLLGSALEGLSRHEEAETAYRNAVKAEPGFELGWLRLGNLLDNTFGRYSEAEEVAQKLVELDPKSADAWLQLGHVREKRLEHFDDAEMAYRKATEVEPRSGHAWTHLGQLALRRGDKKEAERLYRRAIEHEPEYYWPWAKLGELLDETGRFKESEEAFRKITELKPNWGSPWWRLGRLMESKYRRYEDAANCYRRALDVEPHFEPAWASLGDLLQHVLQRPKEAELVCARAVEVNRGSAHLWVHFGHSLAANKKQAEAESAYRKATELEPDFGYAWQALGEFLASSERYPDAEKVLAKAVGLRPQAKLSLIRVRLKEQIDIDPGVIIHEAHCFLQGEGRNPDDLNSLAWSFYESGNPNLLNAAEEFSRESVEKTSHQNWSMIHTLAAILVAQEKWDEAKEIISSLLLTAEKSNEALRSMTDLLITAAAKGKAREVLEILIGSPARTAFEPVEIGLQMYLGVQPDSAREIVEIGKDVAQRIRANQVEDENGLKVAAGKRQVRGVRS